LRLNLSQMKSQIIIIDSAAYEQLKSDMALSIRTEMAKLKEEWPRGSKGQDEWLTPAETRELLGIGRTKYFAMKAEGLFVFTQFGRKAKISRKSVEAFLKKNTIHNDE
jgi:excisionase family DNA binding protein